MIRSTLSASLIFICLCATHLSAKTELGDINGAQFRIDIPENWNGSLVVYCHGYAAAPVTFKEGKLNPVLSIFPDKGYALIQSGYAAGGWAIPEAVNDTEALRRYFVAKYGKPKQTFITGHSMGGFLTMMLMERFPTTYDAGLPLCGPLAPAMDFMARGAFDGRVVFDYYFSGVLPPPDKVPADYQSTPELTNKVQDALDSQPEKAKAVLLYTGIHTTKDLAGSLTFTTYVLKEIEERAGGNPFDNRNIIYETQGDQNAVNDGVKRYAADPRAREYVEAWYTPTGRIVNPMLAVHTTYDNIVPVRIPDEYEQIAERAGTADLFVQQYVKHDGHCNIQPNETAQAFSELIQWKQSGVRPHSGLHPDLGTK